MSVYVQDTDFTLHHGDALEVLREMEPASVHCCVTSPPYWALRDYGHDGQLGLEATPDEYVARMVDVFREVRRVLRDDGTLWLNLGDSYAAGKAGRADSERRDTDGFTGGRKFEDNEVGFTQRAAPPGFKPKDLVGIPWRVAFALQADGWYLRSDIIWSKPNPMPESVTDRPTKAHEYVFLLSKSARYYWDQEAVREHYTDSNGSRLAARASRPGERGEIVPAAKDERSPYYSQTNHRGLPGVGTTMGRYVGPRIERQPQDETLDGSEGESPRGPDGRRATKVEGRDGSIQHRDGERWPNGGRNVRSVWEITTQPFSEWGSTVRQRPVAADAPDGGKKRTASPDCPVHGDHPVPAPTAPYGGHAAGSSSRTGHTDGRPAQSSLDGLASTVPLHEQVTTLGSSSSPGPSGSPIASGRSTETRRTPEPTASGGTASVQTESRTARTSPSHESPAPDGFGSRDSSGTPGRTDCTCAWYVEYTDKTSHFATFPQELPRRCIRAGTSEHGCCSECGAPWQRRIEVDGLPRDRGENGASTVRPDVDPGNASHGRDKISGAKLRAWRDAHPPRDHGWEPTCRCIACPKHGPITGGPESCTECERSPGDPVPVPCTVLDPFMGSGTTALVARNLGRSSIGIELNADYCALAAQRLNQQSLLAGDAA